MAGYRKREGRVKSGWCVSILPWYRGTPGTCISFGLPRWLAHEMISYSFVGVAISRAFKEDDLWPLAVAEQAAGGLV
jgi:hypothetical protein